MPYSGGSRVTAAQLNAAQLVTVTPTGTVSNGTASTGAEARDDVLGVYQWTAVLGLRYRAICSNLLMNGSAADDLWTCNIRYRGDSTTPSASDALVATDQALVHVTGSSGRVGIKPVGTFVATASGTNTIALFTVRVAGSGTGTPVSVNLARELYVELVGSV